MDDILIVEFPIGPRTVRVRRPSEGALFAMTLLRKPADGSDLQGNYRVVQRLVQFLEKITGPDEWAEIQSGMIDEVIKPKDLLDLFGAVLEFDWNAHETKQAPEPEQALEQARPVPRVVSGG